MGGLKSRPNDKGKRLTIKRTYQLDGRKVRTNFIIIKRDAFTQLEAVVGE